MQPNQNLKSALLLFMQKVFELVIHLLIGGPSTINIFRCASGVTVLILSGTEQYRHLVTPCITCEWKIPEDALDLPPTFVNNDNKF